MARRFTVSARLTAEDRASSTVGKVESRFGRLGNFLKRNFVAAMASATVAVFAFVKGLSAVISASQKQEDALNALRAATSKFGDASKDVADRLAEQAAALQKVTRFGDETIIKGQALLATFSDQEEAIRGATTAALNLSTAVGVDLNASFLLLGKALAGDTATLSRYGIIIEEGLAPQEKFAAVLKKINEQFGGRAQEDVKTFSGRVAQLGNAFGDLLEGIGDAITKNDSFKRAISAATIAITENAEAIANATVKTIEFGVAFGAGLVDKFNQVASAIRTINEFMARFRVEIDNTKISTDILRRVAALTGISVEELAANLEGTSKAAKKAGAEIEDAGKEFSDFAKVVKEAGDESKAATDALVGLGEALDVVTSAELAKEIEEITSNLEKSRDELGSNSREFIRLEEIATERIASLQDRIRSLRDGLGDLKTETEASTAAFSSFGEGARTAAVDIDTLTRSTERQTQATRDSTQAAQTSPLLAAGRTTPFNLPGGTFSVPSFGVGGGRRMIVLPNGRLEFVV